MGLPPSRLIVGLVNRYHPMKGHATFLQAARMVLDTGIEATFVCAGRDVSLANPELAELVRGLGLGDKVRLLGERSDTPRLFAAFDVACMTSVWGEGFPNVVGEAMACGTPCVATDIGEARNLIGSTGRVIPPRNPEVMAGAILELLLSTSETRRTVGEAARSVIASRYSLSQNGAEYASLYRAFARGEAAG